MEDLSKRRVRQDNIKVLLDAALDVITDVPIVNVQKRIAKRRTTIRELKDQIARLREKRLGAPTDALLPGITADTVSSLTAQMEDLSKRIKENEGDIKTAKTEISAALEKAGVTIAPAQLDLMLDSVLGGDLIKIVAAFEAVKGIDNHLAALMNDGDENLKTARRYFAMHATLFAMLVHSQGTLIEKIDRVYLKKLDAIRNEIQQARAETKRLLRGANRDDQNRTLQANLKSQKFAEKVATYYRSYLLTQRQQLLQSRRKTLRDLRIADNTYRTVEASFQLRDLIYLKKLDAIRNEIQQARAETKRLLRGANRDDQNRTLQANLKSQKFAEKVATYYRSYLLTQRQQLLQSRRKTLRDLRIADNTYRTVEASFQLRDLIDDARGSFDAIKRMEVPGFDRLFRNEKLRKEFEKLTDQLAPTS